MSEKEVTIITVGFGGRSGAGKTVCADALELGLRTAWPHHWYNLYDKEAGVFCAYHGLHAWDSAPVFRMRLADRLKSGAMAMFALTEEQVCGSEKDTVDSRYGITPRQILQWLGTDVVRAEFGKDHWIQRSISDIMHLIKLSGTDRAVVICDDIRFENEIQAIRDMASDGEISRSFTVFVDGRGNHGDNHASEALGSDSFEIRMWSGGSVGDLMLKDLRPHCNDIWNVQQLMDEILNEARGIGN